MKCGNQPANISMINRRKAFRASRSPSGVKYHQTKPSTRELLHRLKPVASGIRLKPGVRRPSADPGFIRL
jgi:hypothetical protein